MLSDHQLDAALRDVPLPDEYLARLRDALVPSEAQLDQWLAQVAARPGMLLGLKEIPAAVALDEQLTRVAAPLQLAGTMRLPTVQATLHKWRARLEQVVQSLALVWLITISWFGLLAGVLLATYRPFVDHQEYVQIGPYPGPLTINSTLLEAPLVVVLEIPTTDLEPVGPDPKRLATSLETPRNPLLIQPNSASPAELESPFESPLGSPGGGLDPWANVTPGIRSLPNSIATVAGSPGSTGLRSLPPLVLGSPQRPREDLPLVEFPQLYLPRGVEPPLARGYDRLFFLKHHLFPPMVPAAHPALAKFSLPLSTESYTYDQWQRATRWGDKLSPAEIRTEEFIAAQNYQFLPADPGQLAIRTAAGPSLFGGPGATLWQLGVQAGQQVSIHQPKTHLIVLVDAAAPLAQRYSLGMFQQAVARLLQQRQPSDQISILIGLETVNESGLAHFQLEQHLGIDRQEANSILEVLTQVQLRGKSHSEALLREGLLLALQTGQQTPSLAAQVVLLTGDESSLAGIRIEEAVPQVTSVQPPVTAADGKDRSLASLLAAVQKTGCKLQLVWGEARLGERLAKSPFALWSEKQGRKILPCESTAQLYRGLVTAMGSHPGPGTEIIATHATLTLKLRPKTVAAYRLLGHESGWLHSNSASVQFSTTLYEGETASSLLEMWLHEGSDDDLGECELTWVDPSGKPQKTSQRLSRLQITPTWEESAISLQQATIAAEAAEVLRGSREKLREIGLNSGSSSGLPSVLAAAGRVNPQVWQRPGFAELVAGLQRQLVSRKGNKNSPGAPFKGE